MEECGCVASYNQTTFDEAWRLVIRRNGRFYHRTRRRWRRLREEGVLAPLERHQHFKSVDGLLRCHLGHTYLEVDTIELAELARQQLGDESHVGEHGGAVRCGRNSCSKTPGHQPASLEVHGRIASILAAMDGLDCMSSRFVSEIHEDFAGRLRAGELDTAQKRKKLLDAYAEEL
ncbi:hypothetical protein [Rhizobium grahamii]|uniref:Recombinase n=1 Tax=Rhizobium grahamii CCGE 502 TaxID=990285 RepID=S3HLA3_9HYPH|nr:hypothetical protein [Rhizobium grahamii]EPE94146.1 recombinase [Rhizobium grahamii CCGE 502]